MSEPLLEMRGISKSFGGNPVLSDVDLRLWPGEVHALVGENGAGKSTLLRTLAGLLKPAYGEVRILDAASEAGDPRAGAERTGDMITAPTPHQGFTGVGERRDARTR